LCAIVLVVCALTVVRTFGVETFHIPSGSMAPTLLGYHRVTVCPRCGQEVVVGRHAADQDGSGPPRLYRKAFCPNCGLYPVPLRRTEEVRGDQIVVSKTAYLVRAPSRWEIVVFRLFGMFYIKRLLGLPGEEILIRDGDLYVNGELCRKSFAEARAMRVLVFDQEKAPAAGWRERWEHTGAHGPHAAELVVRPGDTLTYRHFLLDAGKCEPIRDEYAYNAGLHARNECVHDFLIETEIETSAGRGAMALRLCDGRDWIEVLLPVGQNRPVEAFAWPIDAPEQMRKLAETESKNGLRPGRRCAVELAFVDRRVTLVMDGRVCLVADLPEAKRRRGVERPFQVHTDGVTATLRRFRLYRDVHYGQQGTNGVRGHAVRLEADQYFMLGDNSPNSEDSRFWPDDGRVDAACLIGPMLSVRARRD
jgi:signal peptidase I